MQTKQRTMQIKKQIA